MKRPEMSYNLAYNQDRGQYPRNAIFAATSTAHSSLDHPSVPAEVLCRPSSTSSSSYEVSRTSIPPSPSHPLYSMAGSSRPGTEPRVEVDSFVTGPSMSSGAHKEEHTWANPETPASHIHQQSNADDNEAADDGQDALLTLFRLSVPVPIFSFCAALYAILALVFALLVSPLRLCSLSPTPRAKSFRSQLCDLLSPALHIHERLVHMRHPLSARDRSSSTQWIHSELEPAPEPVGSCLNSSAGYSVGALVVVLLLSPFFSMSILLFAWTAAFFWVFAMVLGNPDGTERKDDGRAAVLGVCKWWQAWLSKARKV